MLDSKENKNNYFYIDGEKKTLNPDNIFRTYAFNIHADLDQILNIFKNTKPENIFLVHLNQEETTNLVNNYKQFFPNSKIILPELMHKYDLN